MLKYKLVIFDFDGTLADSFAMFQEAWNIAAKRHGLKQIAEDDLERLRGCSAREIVAEVGLPWWKLPSMTRHMRELMRERIDNVRLFDGVEATLRTLKSEGVKVAVVTSNSRENVERVLGAEGTALVDHFGCGASIFGKKSKIRSVMKASGVSSKEVLCVGDEIRDAEAAQGLKLDFAAVSWGYTNPEHLEQLPGVRMCKSVLDVLAIALV